MNDKEQVWNIKSSGELRGVGVKGGRLQNKTGSANTKMGRWRQNAKTVAGQSKTRMVGH